MNNPKSGKLLSIVAETDQFGNQKSFQNSYGTFYPHLVTFDNGDSGSVNIKNTPQPNPQRFKVGDTYQYELTPGEFGNKIKLVGSNNNSYGGGGGKGKSSELVTVLGFAGRWTTDLCVASGNYDQDSWSKTFEGIFNIVRSTAANAGKPATNDQAPQQATQQAPPPPPAPSLPPPPVLETSDDLPF